MICPVYLHKLQSSETQVTRPAGIKAPRAGHVARIGHIVAAGASQPSRASIASNRLPAMLRLNAASSSLMPVGLVTLISVR